MSRSSTANLHPPPNVHINNSNISTTSDAKTLTLWIHDPDASLALSKHEAVLNYELFPSGAARPGDVAEVRLISSIMAPSGAVSSDGYSSGGGCAAGGGTGGHMSDGGATNHNREGNQTASMGTMDDMGAWDARQTKEEEDGKFLFVIRELDDTQRKLNVQISLATHVATLFGFPSRATVRVTIVEKPLHEASHVEVYFRGQYITRNDIWRMTTSLLAETCPYKSQKLLFINSIRATVGSVWVRGQKVRSAYFSHSTVPIFRSESAKYFIFIQMSREMWHFDTDDGGDGDDESSSDPLVAGTGGVGGEIMINKLINGFLPELFKRWRRIEAHHLVSLVLFTRIVYEHGEPVGVINSNDNEGEDFLGTPGGIEIGEGRRYRDFFRVVVSNMGSVDWAIILYRLKREFAIFLRDVLVQPVPDDDADQMMVDLTPPVSSSASMVSRPGTPAMMPADKFRPYPISVTSGQSPRLMAAPKPMQPNKTIITGRPSAAIHGNVLEAINLATVQFSRGYIDRDLVRTGVSIVLVTPGTGHFEVDYEMLQAATEGLVANGMGIDLVCLSKVPLHKVPLFRYRNPVRASSGKNDDNRTNSNNSPPKQKSPNVSLQPGEWVYAMPHWIDVSFWSSASEKKTRRNRGVDSGRVKKKKDVQFRKRKSSQRFQARCKMYELQMMGIMENETSCITVPFLHDNPLWKPFPDQGPGVVSGNPREIGNKEAEKKRKEQWKEDNFKWMDEYDDIAFRPLPVLQKVIWEAEERRSGTVEQNNKVLKTLIEDPLVLGTSFRADSMRGSGSALDGGFFDRKMKERRPELESPTESKSQSIIPAISDSDNGNVGGRVSLLGRPGRLARQISFGLKAWGGATKSAAKATTTDATGLGTMTSGLGPGGVVVTRGFDTGDSPKTPLSPKFSTRESRLNVSPEKPNMRGSRPISITGVNSAASAVEAATREKERRRNMVGSPLEHRAISGMRDPKTLKTGSSLSRPGHKTDLVAIAEKTANIPLTVSPTSALAPWVEVLNPSNPKKDTHSFASQYRRWHHVFPKPVKTSSVKWKSLCTPASLPLTTEHFPTAEQLATEYQESPYVISQNSDYELMETGNREALVRAMIAHRLTQGFQIAVGRKVAEATQGRGGQAGVYDKNYMGKPGSSCFMSRGSQIHQLICDEEYNVEVKRYIRKPTTAITTRTGDSDEYTNYIKTMLKPNYLPVKASFRQPVSDYNWNYADQYIGGYEDDLKDQLRYWRTRFVLIPCDPPETARRGQPHGAELNDEEIRLEGIRRLTMIFQRNRYTPPAERHYERFIGRQKLKEKNPLQILYKTVDPSVAVAQELESFFVPDTDGHLRRSQLLVTEIFESKNLDIKAIAQELQGSRGVRLQDRRWHLRLHNNCFIGEEMVTWIVENFKDVETRQEAEQVGTNLFKAGLFQHVDKRHEFRDGNYFYRIADPYVISTRPGSKGGWFPNFKNEKPIAATPLAELSSPLRRNRSRSNSILTEESMTEGAKTPTAACLHKKKVDVELSKSMEYDVDTGRKSYRPEIVTLHYDRLHNPDNCYHIRIDWLNTTAKLIEDSLTSWARNVDRYGLKLVEAPIDEVSNLSKANPFRAPTILRPVLPPPPPPSSPRPSVSTVSSATTAPHENMELSTILSPLSIGSTPPPPPPPPLPPPPSFPPLPSPSSQSPPPSHPHPPPPPVITPQPQTIQQHDHWIFYKAMLKKFNFVLDTEAASSFPSDVNIKYSWGINNYKWSQYIHRTGVLFCQISDTGEFHLMANRSYTFRVNHPPHHHIRRETPSNDSCGLVTSPSATYPSAAVVLGGISPPMSTIESAAGNCVPTPESIVAEMERFMSDYEALKRFYEDVIRPFDVKGVDVRCGLVGGRWNSPVIAPVGVVKMGSPTVSASEVNAGGRTVSVSGRSGISDDLNMGDFMLAR